MARVAVQQDAVFPRGWDILKEVFICHMRTIDSRLIGHCLDAALKHDGFRHQMRLGYGLVAEGIAIRGHRGEVRTAHCKAGERKHTIEVCVIPTALTAGNSLAADRVRIGSSFAGRLASAVDIDEQMVLCCFLGQDIQQLDNFLALRIKEVRLNALDAHISPFLDALALFRRIQVALVRPNNQANTLLFCIIQDFLHPVIVTVVQVVAAVVHARLPAFI